MAGTTGSPVLGSRASEESFPKPKCHKAKKRLPEDPSCSRIDGGEAQVLTVQSCGGAMPSVVPGEEGLGGAPHCGAGATSVMLAVRHSELNAIFFF